MKIPKLPKLVIEDEVKIITLVCYLLKNLDSSDNPLTEEQLLEIVTTDGVVPTLKLNDALTVIEKKGLAKLATALNTVTVPTAPKGYQITEIGSSWVKEFEGLLPSTLRNKMLREGKNIVRMSSLKKALRWGISESKGDWIFKATFLNEFDGSPIMEISIHSKTKEMALKAQEKLLENPAEVLKTTISNFI